jgi:hypothetical protein
MNFPSNQINLAFSTIKPSSSLAGFLTYKPGVVKRFCLPVFIALGSDFPL